MNLLALGIDFRSAPLELREAAAFSPADIPRALRELRRDLPDTELMLLSTCNRTELYAAGDLPDDHRALLSPLLRHRTALPENALEAFRVIRGRDAIEHLMAVAASIDSMVVGETEVLGQVKQAYTVAVDAATAGPILQPLLQQAFRVAKRVRTETAICAGRVSVGSIAVDLAESIFDRLDTKTAMILGAGEVAEQTVKVLLERGIRDTVVLNRSLDNACALACRYGGTAAPLERLADHLHRADIVIASTAAPEPIIDHPTARHAAARRQGNPLCLIDLAVPRDIAGTVADIPKVYLYNIDDLRHIADANLRTRRQAIAHARRIIAEELDGIAGCACHRDSLAEIMRQLDSTTEAIRDAELQRIFEKRRVATRDEQCAHCRKEIRIMLDRSLKKITAPHRRALNQAARNGSWEQYAAIARHLLGVDQPDQPDRPPTSPSATSETAPTPPDHRSQT